MTVDPISGHKGRTLRRARESDTSAVKHVVDLAYKRLARRLGRLPLQMQVDHRKAIAEHQVWVVEHNREIVAVLELVHGKDHLLLENIAVRPSHQRQGLGHQLMSFAEAETVRQRFGEIRAYTPAAFTENLALYKSLGYDETRREDRDGLKLVHLTKLVAGVKK